VATALLDAGVGRRVKGLAKVIDVDAAKCANCHACIATCPVKFCNDASGDHVTIIPDKCVGCGNCIDACTHGARTRIDDFDAFLNDLRNGVKTVAVVAPAVAAAYGKDYLRLNGWLKSIGVVAAFDVSFGAELTVKTYVDFIAKTHAKTVIAQPCPALVSYIEIYRPELLKNLAPADSPMLHTMKMIERFYPQYKGCRFVVISPCVAKRREFDDTGYGDYNVTLASIEKFMEESRTQMRSFPEIDYDNPPAERAVLFSTPGGLQETVRRWSPDAAHATRKIEGPSTIYHYLDHLPQAIQQGIAPLLVDCLNCELGCNGGTGTTNRHKGCDQLEHSVAQRAQEMKKRYGERHADAEIQENVLATIDEYWEPGLYGRSYVDRHSLNDTRKPSSTELDKIYGQMKKTKAEDIRNCASCGYGTCEMMATAIFNGLNRPENCHFYQTALIEAGAASKKETLREVMLNFDQVIGQVSEAAKSTAQLDKIAVAIIKLAKQTHMISLNAAIEAYRAGHAGAAFGVVADAVRDLAESVRREANAIDPCSKDLHEAFEAVSNDVQGLSERVLLILEEEGLAA
jgi:Na+-translocating ferredoxin:NAD+ oxidoreductase RNF subunit RnfB